MSAQRLLVLAFVGCIATPGCASSGAAPVVVNRALPQSGSPGQYISHVVVIIQENRSFENFFAGYPGADAPMWGCAIPETKTVMRHRTALNCPSGDITVPLKAITFDDVDLGHDWQSSQVSWDAGRMDGFSKFCCNGGPYPAYSYVEQSLIKPYWRMAQQYVLADEMFPTEWGGSFTGHLTLVAGTDDIQQSPSEAEIDNPQRAPYDCDSPPGTKSSYVTANRKIEMNKGPFPCFNQWNSIAQVLDAAGVSWKYYATKKLDAGLWEPFEALQYVRYGSDWANIIAPQTKILTDPGKGDLASVSFVTPSLQDSDHPPFRQRKGSDRGPSWVASVVNAIGASSYWSSSAIIVLWDDWGGWFDNARPPQLDYRGLGFRVPCLIISPYAKTGYVDSTQYEFGSILRFIEEVYGTPSIGPVSEGYTDGRATSLDDAFDFSQLPRSFEPIPTKYSASNFLHEPPSRDELDTQ